MIIKAAWLVDVYNASTQKGYKGYYVEVWAEIKKPVSADLGNNISKAFLKWSCLVDLVVD